MKQINVLGIGFVILGMLTLFFYGFYVFLMSTDIPYFVRVGAVFLAIGIAIVLLSIIREKVHEAKGIKIES